MTGKNIYDYAAQLLACKNANGSDNADCADYVSRAPALISILLAENLSVNRLLRADSGLRAMPISSLAEEVDCHELLAVAVIPFGLAALLVADEDSTLSQSLYQRYLLNIKAVKETASSIRHEIEDCYKYNG